MLYLGSKGYMCTNLYVYYIKMINKILELGSYIEDVLYLGSNMYKPIGKLHKNEKKDLGIGIASKMCYT